MILFKLFTQYWWQNRSYKYVFKFLLLITFPFVMRSYRQTIARVSSTSLEKSRNMTIYWCLSLRLWWLFYISCCADWVWSTLLCLTFDPASKFQSGSLTSPFCHPLHNKSLGGYLSELSIKIRRENVEVMANPLPSLSCVSKPMQFSLYPHIGTPWYW